MFKTVLKFLFQVSNFVLRISRNWFRAPYFLKLILILEFRIYFFLPYQNDTVRWMNQNAANEPLV